MNQEAINEITTLFKEGFKFYTIGDNDPWYIVANFTDNEKLHFVIKSWAKYKQRWIYKVEWSLSLLYYIVNKEKNKTFSWYEKVKDLNEKYGY